MRTLSTTLIVVILFTGCASGPAAEQCDNGWDDDWDGLTDCDDPACANHPSCAEVPPDPDPEDCDDGIDNDNDGMVDCADPDCQGWIACVPPELCGDGLDNDLDGAADCADPDCAQESACVGSEICGDGIDNDNDGKTDCEDVACLAVPACQTTEVCFDGIDNDNDGDVDCADSDCQILVACQGSVVEKCDDGVDNDSDGAVDCADSDCSAAANCQPTDVCSGSPDGYYCGGDLGGLADHASVYHCVGGLTASVNTCANGCAGGSCVVPPSDPCASATSGNGAYCGSNLSGGTADTLYNCLNGVTASSTPCANGCKVNPPGTPDECYPASDPCTSATSGDGYYCGGNLSAGLASVLYYCQGGSTLSETTCAEGCQMNPPGTPDQCVVSSGGSCCLLTPPGTLTQSYSACGLGGSHYGIDLGTPIGTPIYAGMSGTVVSHRLGLPNCYNNGCTQACWNAFNYIKILADCADPNNAANDFYIYYLHIDAVAAGITNGSHVDQGQLLAYSGNSGCSSGPHIHLETASVPSGQSASLNTCNSPNPANAYCQ